MARYLIFEKTKSYDYKFKGSSTGATGNKAILNLKMRTNLNKKSPYIAVPTTQFMKYQLNPKDQNINGRKSTIWKKPK